MGHFNLKNDKLLRSDKIFILRKKFIEDFLNKIYYFNMEAYIYKYTNKENGKTYIGSRSAYSGSCYDDFNINYFSSSKDKQFLEDMKNGLLIGEIVLVLNEENANKKILEIEYNMITDFWNKYGKQMSYNHYANGQFSNAGEHFSEEHKRKLSEANKGKQDGERGPMYGRPGTMLGKHHSYETRKKISESNKGVLHGPMTEEHKKKLSESHKGKKYGKYSEERVRKVALANTGKKHPHNEDTKRRISETMLSNNSCVKQYKNYLTETGEIINMRASLAKRWHPNWKEVI